MDKRSGRIKNNDWTLFNNNLVTSKSPLKNRCAELHTGRLILVDMSRLLKIVFWNPEPLVGQTELKTGPFWMAQVAVKSSTDSCFRTSRAFPSITRFHFGSAKSALVNEVVHREELSLFRKRDLEVMYMAQQTELFKTIHSKLLVSVVLVVT